MKTSDPAAIERALNQYGDLEEAILWDVFWKDYGMTLELTFELVRDREGTLIVHLPEEQRKVLIRLSLVQEFHLRNALNDSMLEEPERVNWGLSEIAYMGLTNDSQLLKPYMNRPKPFNHLVCFWERERRIDVIFSLFEIDGL